MSTGTMLRETVFWRKNLFALGLMAIAGSIVADVTTNDLPQIQAVYGGRINAINAIELAGQPNRVRIFAATESANSVFYGDVNHALTAPYATNNFKFTVVPDFDANADFGTVSGIAGHPASGRLFVADDVGLLSCDPTTGGTRITNIVGQTTPPPPPAPVPPQGPRFIAVLIRDSVLMAIGNSGSSNLLYFGAIAADGTFTQDAASPIPLDVSSGVNTRTLLVHPINRHLYIGDREGTNGLLKSSSACTALSAATTFASVPLPAAVASWTGGKAFGIGPDGRLFVAGASGGSKALVYSDDDGASWTPVDTSLLGGSADNVECVGDTNHYYVFFGSGVSTNKGVSHSWQGLGYGSFETHPNDGATAADPLDLLTAYVTTDQGIGASTNGGQDLFEIDYGLEAVQIQDLDMNAAKTLAWTASKSGLRRGIGAPMALEWTPNGIFPMGDGSPYYSIAIDKSDENGRTLYAGNVNIYKSTDSGTNWHKVWDIFNITNVFRNGGYFSSLAVTGPVVAAGFYDQQDTYGGLLVSQDSGSSWAVALTNMDINDVLFMDNYILAAAAYDATSGAGGVYRVTPTGTSRELTNAVSIRNLARDSFGGVYACGQDVSYAIKVYYRSPGGSAWTDISTTGLPSPTAMVNGRGPVMTVGVDSDTNDLPLIAANVSLYYLVDGDTTWQTSAALTYPNGSQINTLYWDELMVGTSAGLFGQHITATRASSVTLLAADFDGDLKADPALYAGASGAWYIKLSGSGYDLITLPYGNSNYAAVARDFDGDLKADPALYKMSNGKWKVALSRSGYAEASLNNFGGPDYRAVAGDYDGDRLADPAVYHTANGDWYVALSGQGYAIAGVTGFGGAGYAAVEQNYDSDRRFDPAVYRESNGNWTILLSAANYITATLWGFGGAGYEPVMGDFDGDGKADPAVYNAAAAALYVRTSGSGYNLATLSGFGGAGYGVAAADFDGDRKADPTLLDLATGVWHIRLSGSGYTEATLASGWEP